jgi:hypothetical protein
MRTKDLWLKFGCFITGYNYQLIINSSEASAKFVKKNLSAFLIISILWGFIGFSFAKRYVHLNDFGASIVAFIMIVIVIQVERQITMTMHKNNWAVGFRIAIGIVMAIIGSIILDQIIFKEDVEKKNISLIQEEVNRILPTSAKETDLQIKQLDSSIAIKESERLKLIGEFSSKPYIKVFESETYVKDSSQKMNLSTFKTKEVQNPKFELIKTIDEQLKVMRAQNIDKQKYKINIREELEKVIKEKRGFLDELGVLRKILSSDLIALFVWILLFIFFLSLELFVLVNKLSNNKLDYDKLISHQVETKIAILENLGK